MVGNIFRVQDLVPNMVIYPKIATPKWETDIHRLTKFANRLQETTKSQTWTTKFTDSL